jgi:sigma-B regulation protein RsbU (phosphoserine phosphatase)
LRFQRLTSFGNGTQKCNKWAWNFSAVGSVMQSRTNARVIKEHNMLCQTENPVMALPALELHGIPERPRILVAEDQTDVVMALHLLLKRNGYEAEFVKCPEDALEALRNRPFDAALLDLNYSRDTTSGSEGLELVAQALAIDSTLAVVVMTAWSSVELAVKAMHRGACDFVQKPWDNAQLLSVLGLQIERCRSLRQQRLSEQQEQLEAAQIQRGLMPRDASAPAGMAIAATSQSARTVGGDYYDIIRLDQSCFALCIADVVGKGVAAALLMSNLQASVRMLAPEVRDTAALCGRINEAISANNVPGKFITFFYCVLDSAQRRVRFTNAGHNWPMLAHADGSVERLNSEDTVLGAASRWTYHQQELELRSGDRLVLFTDGISETCDDAGTEFGEDQLLELVRDNLTLSAAALKSKLLEAARSHCRDKWADDATLIVLAVD